MGKRKNFYVFSAKRRGKKIKRVIRTTLSLSQLKMKFATKAARLNLKNVVIRKITQTGAVRLVIKSKKRRRIFRFSSGEGFRL